MTTRPEQTLERCADTSVENKYYWLASQQLAAGSVVEPGTWYKIVSNTSGHNHALLEEVYERVRAQEFPDMPSRQKSMFIFENKAVALNFKQENSWGHTDLYEVTVENAGSKHAKLNADLVSIGISGRLRTTAELIDVARSYWQTANDSCRSPELLFESPIKIIGKVEA